MAVVYFRSIEASECGIPTDQGVRYEVLLGGNPSTCLVATCAVLHIALVGYTLKLFSHLFDELILFVQQRQEVSLSSMSRSSSVADVWVSVGWLSQRGRPVSCAEQTPS